MSTAPPSPARFAGLDRLKGVALALMVVHHLLSWTMGGDRARPLLGWIDDMAVTDLAAPMFAVGVGAAAVAVGRRRPVGDWSGFGRGARRWAVIAAWGVALGISTDGDLDSFGVLESLAVAGIVLAAALVVVRPSTWQWLAAAVLTTAAAPVVLQHVVLGETPGPVALVDAVAGTFPIVSYLALALWGATAASALGDAERPAVLAGLAATGVVALAAWHVTGHAGWPPDRGPAILPFLLPGVVATFLLWSGLAALPPSALTAGLERAGRRTLVVFVAHYAIRFVIDTGGWLGVLDGPVWTASAVAACAAIVVAAMLPWERRARRGEPGDAGLVARTEGKRGPTAGLVPSHG